jgi:hypothetical protein
MNSTNILERAKLQWRTMNVQKTFFDCKGNFHHEFLPHGQMVNKQYYLKVTNRLREAVRRKRPDLWRRKKMVAPS